MFLYSSSEQYITFILSTLEFRINFDDDEKFMNHWKQ